MNVKTLQLFLETLVNPLETCGSPERVSEQLRRIVTSLEKFENNSLEEFALFLERSHQYEKEGQWPELKPTIAGNIVDQATPQEYAKRVITHLQKEVGVDGTFPESVFEELKELRIRMKLTQLREMAKDCGVTSGISSATAPKIIEKTFEQLTGQKFGDAIINSHKTALENAREDRTVLSAQIEHTLSSLDSDQLKKLAKQLGAKGSIKKKSEAEVEIRKLLLPVAQEETQDVAASEETPPKILEMEPSVEEKPETKQKLDRIVETIQELKVKATPSDAPYDEIEEEISRLEQELDKEEAIEVATRLGVDWTLSNKAQAMREIREEVFEQKFARERVEY